jgi:hypothetical protein
MMSSVVVNDEFGFPALELVLQVGVPAMFGVVSYVQSRVAPM